MKAVKMSPAKSRIHAMSAYGAARYYKLTGNFDLYEEYLVEASVTDGLCQLKETVALQKLAYFLFKKDASNSKRAAKYIQHTMEDAQFFNNRLRMMEFQYPPCHRFCQPAGCREITCPFPLRLHRC